MCRNQIGGPASATTSFFASGRLTSAGHCTSHLPASSRRPRCHAGRPPPRASSLVSPEPPSSDPSGLGLPVLSRCRIWAVYGGAAAQGPLPPPLTVEFEGAWCCARPRQPAPLLLSSASSGGDLIYFSKMMRGGRHGPFHPWRSAFSPAGAPLPPLLVSTPDEIHVGWSSQARVLAPHPDDHDLHLTYSFSVLHLDSRFVIFVEPQLPLPLPRSPHLPDAQRW